MEKGNKPAFPSNNVHDKNGDLVLGITKREYFAAKAMQGFLSDHLQFAAIIKAADDKNQDVDVALANACIGLVDTLLKELDK